MDIQLSGCEKICEIEVWFTETITYLEIFIHPSVECPKNYSCGHCGMKVGNVKRIKLDHDEYLTGIFGRCSYLINSIGFTTNKRRIESCGGNGGNPFEMEYMRPISRIVVDSQVGKHKPLTARMIEKICIHASNINYNPATARFKSLLDLNLYKESLSFLKDHDKSEAEVDPLKRTTISGEVEFWSVLLSTKIEAEVIECAEMLNALSNESPLRESQMRRYQTLLNSFALDKEIQSNLKSLFQSVLKSKKIYNVKVIHESNCKRFCFDEAMIFDDHRNISFDKMRQQIIEYFPSLRERTFKLMYEDNEGDVITVSSDCELVEAFRIMNSMNVISFHVILLPEDLKPPVSNSVTELPQTSKEAQDSVTVVENNDITPENQLIEVPDSDVTEETSSQFASDSQFLRLSSTSSAPIDLPFNFALLNHVTFPDGSEVEPGTSLTKTWKVRNTGTSCWPVGTRPVAMDLQSTGSLSLQLQQLVSPGDEVDVSVQLKVPESVGHFHGAYRMQIPATEDSGIFETVFGSLLSVDLEVLDQESEWAFILHDEEKRDAEMDQQKGSATEREEDDDEDMFPSFSLYKSLLFDNAVEVVGNELNQSSIQSSGADTLKEIASLSRGVSAANCCDEKLIINTKHTVVSDEKEHNMKEMVTVSDEVGPTDSNPSEEIVKKCVDNPKEQLPVMIHAVETKELPLETSTPQSSVEFYRSMARAEEVDLLMSMGFGDMTVLLPLLEQHVNQMSEQMDMEAIQRIIAILLN
mmetsp:Transcript_3201/g.4570  ORF Transcript_3201/g.4570 Transcript_3201/m.4570 type:complete len:753 (+) Transcript_3201:82-2340(+)